MIPHDTLFGAVVAEHKGTQPPLVLAKASHRGDGAFGPAQTLAQIGRAPRGLAVLDIDADGDLDLITASHDENTVSLRRNEGGDFAGGGDFHAVSRPQAMAIADLDGDTRPDLVVTGETDTAILIGEAGGFERPLERSFGAELEGVAVGDMDADGLTEVVLPDRRAGRLLVLPGGLRGPTTAAECHPYALVDGERRCGALDALRPGAIALGDFDGDRRLDVVTAGDGKLRVLCGEPGRGLGCAWPEVEGRGEVMALAVADLDGDATQDLVTVECAPNRVGVLMGDGAGAFAPLETPLPRCPSSLAIAELTGDGQPDLLLGLTANGRAELLLLVGAGDGTFAAAETIDLGPADAGARVLAAAADVSGDGALDLLAATTAGVGGVVYARMARGSAAYPPRETLVLGPEIQAATLADVNHDGWPDVVALSPRLSTVELRLSVDGAFDSGASIDLPFEPWSVLPVDVDRDGRTDLAVTDEEGRELVVLIGDGEGGFAVDHQRTLAQCPVPAPERCGVAEERAHKRLELADLDADGSLELVAGTCAGDLAVLGDYAAGVGFASAARRFGTRCTDNFDFLDVDGRWAPLTFGRENTAFAVHLPEGAAELPGFRRVHAEGLSDADILGIVRGGNLDPLFPLYEVKGARLMVVDWWNDGADEISMTGFGENLGWRSTNTWFRPDGDLRAALEAPEAYLGWRNDFISWAPASRGETAADLNGDGRPDWLYPWAELDQIVWRLVAPEDWTRTRSPTGARSRSVRVGDANRDGAPDLLVTAPGAGTATLLRMPAPGLWRQRLADRLRARTPLPPGPSRHRVRQAMQRLDRLGVYLRAEGAGAQSLSFVLRSPRGECVALEAPAPDEQGVVRLHARWDELDFGPMLGWQPQGDWVLEVENEGDLTPALLDFEILTWGAFVGPSPGSRQSAPKALRMRNGALGRALRETTLGGVDSVALSCGDTHSPGGDAPERWFELEVAEARSVELRVAADFPAALELRRGACVDEGAVLDCDAGSFGPRLAPRVLEPGTWCVVVDGDLRGAHEVARGGRFDLFATLDEGWARPDDPPALAQCDAPAPIERSIACGEATCEGESVCCAGFAGTRCAAGEVCGGGELAITCDGPEECAPGERCCAGFPLGAACLAECGANDQIRCHEDADCGGLRCQSCDFPPLGAVMVCADDCP